jgi:hypothetical protein
MAIYESLRRRLERQQALLSELENLTPGASSRSKYVRQGVYPDVRTKTKTRTPPLRALDQAPYGLGLPDGPGVRLGKCSALRGRLDDVIACNDGEVLVSAGFQRDQSQKPFGPYERSSAYARSSSPAGL